MSTMVVMNGLAITAGSTPILFAIIGRVAPTNFATITASSNVRHTTKATVTPTRSKTRSFTKLHIPNVTPHRSAVRISFQITRYQSLNRISSSESPRMIMALAWPPAFPPVSSSCKLQRPSSSYKAYRKA